METPNFGLLQFQGSQGQQGGMGETKTQNIPSVPQASGGGLEGLLGGSGGGKSPISGLLNGLFGKSPLQAVNKAVGAKLGLNDGGEQGGFNTGQPTAPDSVLKPNPGYVAPQQAGQNQVSPPPPARLAGTGNTASDLSIPNIIRMAHEQFPNNPNMANLAAAQAIQESGLAGKPSQLATKHNNLFGMKGHGDAGSVNYASAEYGSGGWSKPTSGFASYSSPQQSMAAYAHLMQNPRYERVREAKNFQEAAQAVRAAGYATDPNYTASLNNIYNRYIAPVEQGQRQSAPQSDKDTGELEW